MAALILLDNSAVFDTVSHPILIQCLQDIGIEGPTLRWICSFLTGRVQSVSLAPFISNTCDLICGVPQGSSLSPTLFNVYMISLVNVKHPLQ